MAYSDKQKPHDLSNERARIHVSQGEWNFAEDPQIIETSGLGPCIGVAVFDPFTKEGSMAHFQGPSQDTYPVERFLATAVGSSSDPLDVHVWVRGGEILQEPDLKEHCKADREFIERAVYGSGVDEENVDIVWNEDNDISIGMSLDCAIGELHDSSVDLKHIIESVAKSARHLDS